MLRPPISSFDLYLSQRARCLKQSQGYLYRQHQRRDCGEITGYSWKEIFVYGFLLLLCLFTLGFGLMLFLASKSTDDKELI